MIILVTLAAMTVAGSVAWLVFRQGPRLIEAPRIKSSVIWKAIERHERLATLVRSRLDPMEATGLALTLSGIIVVLGAVGFGLLLFMVRSDTGFARLDLSAARFGQRHATAVSTRLLNDFSQLGGAVILVPLAVLVGLLALWRWRTFMILAFLAFCVGGQFAVADLIKFAVGRARPNIDQLTGFSGSSFPSGHATAAAATFAALALIAAHRRTRRTQVALGAVAVAIAVGVGCTRILLGVHWLTDVLAGLALGWAWFAICSIAFGGRMFRFGAPAEEAQRAAEVIGDGSSGPEPGQTSSLGQGTASTTRAATQWRDLLIRTDVGAPPLSQGTPSRRSTAPSGAHRGVDW